MFHRCRGLLKRPCCFGFTESKQLSVFIVQPPSSEMQVFIYLKVLHLTVPLFLSLLRYKSSIFTSSSIIMWSNQTCTLHGGAQIQSSRATDEPVFLSYQAEIGQKTRSRRTGSGHPCRTQLLKCSHLLLRGGLQLLLPLFSLISAALQLFLQGYDGGIHPLPLLLYLVLGLTYRIYNNCLLA